MNFFLHANAICESSKIGPRTRIWAFAHVLPGATIGEDCNICDGVFIENDVIVGDRTTIKCGVQLWDGIKLGNDVFVGPNATFTNDIFPRSRARPETYAETVVEDGASIGANSTILPGLRIGSGAMIGAGTVVTRSVPPNAIVVGNPGRIKGYVTNSNKEVAAPAAAASGDMELQSSRVNGVKLHRLKRFSDMRGSLTVGEIERDLPFEPKRFFMVFDVPTRETRGEHAHQRCHQFLICIKGSVRVLADDGNHRDEFLLDTPDLGLHLPPMTWGTQYQYSRDAVLMVFASETYDADEYIRDYDEFLRMSRASG
jgi:acetyltransferase-like isoleucine patch superfamily enzyme/dTDP-4-dehydrorhamnose 3,5-epimerase-like enzyme